MATEDRPPAQAVSQSENADRKHARDRKAPPFRFTDFAMI